MKIQLRTTSPHAARVALRALVRSLLGAALLAPALLAATAGVAVADDRPRVIVSPSATVNTDQVRLGDIAQITARHKEFAELVADLKKLPLAQAPAPRMTMELPGLRILEAVREAGISPDSFGYSIPVAVHITRDGHIVTKDEVLSAVREALYADAALDVRVRDVSWSHAQVVPRGKREVIVERLGEVRGGSVPLRLEVRVDDAPAARFLATAVADDWREIPVLNRTMERGMLISPDDIELIRLNLFNQPPDVLHDSEKVVGRRLTTRIAAGTTIRKAFIDIPPIIEKGRKVKMVYESGGLSATASGVAMEDGHDGALMKVKNERSRRVIQARVVNEDTVKVE